MSDYTPSLHRLARLARSQPALLAGLLAIYQEQLPEAELAALLGIDQDGLTRLALCRRPRMEPAHFRADIERIAGYVRVNPAQLARLVRAAVAFEQRAAAPGSASHILLAARDWDDEQPDQTEDPSDG